MIGEAPLNREKSTPEPFIGRRISVIGAARSGLAAARVLGERGASVLLSDAKSEAALGASAANARAIRVRCVFEASVEAALPVGTDLVVTSPGVPVEAPVLRAAVERGLPIWSEIELAYRIAGAPLIGVTGTNGKTTTTMLLGAMLAESGMRAIVCGNVSADDVKKPLVEAAHEACGPEDVLVAEISSFQLEWVDRFAPRVAVLTNVTADHLNRHRSFEEYAKTKARIFAAQSPDDWAVYGYDNPISRSIGESARSRRAWFSTCAMPECNSPCAWVEEGLLRATLGAGNRPTVLLRAGDMPETLPGKHSIANVLAASLAALAMGAPVEAIQRAVREFPGVPHRMERVGSVHGVRFINNSMCTNVAAAICSLDAMSGPTVVIAGGADKRLEFGPLAASLRERAKHLILIGSAADKMEAAFRAGGYGAISRADSMESAVTAAAKLAEPGEAVLLSPCCASFDMFDDFEARGAAFRNAVARLEERS